MARVSNISPCARITEDPSSPNVVPLDRGKGNSQLIPRHKGVYARFAVPPTLISRKRSRACPSRARRQLPLRISHDVTPVGAVQRTPAGGRSRRETPERVFFYARDLYNVYENVFDARAPPPPHGVGEKTNPARYPVPFPNRSRDRLPGLNSFCANAIQTHVARLPPTSVIAREPRDPSLKRIGVEFQ